MVIYPLLINISATVPWARSGVFLGPSTEMTVGQRDCLTIWLSYCCIVGAPGPVTCSFRELSWGRFSSFFLQFFCLSFVSLFWPPGRPKRSIVANLAPKITPKRSPKWSQKLYKKGACSKTRQSQFGPRFCTLEPCRSPPKRLILWRLVVAFSPIL